MFFLVVAQRGKLVVSHGLVQLLLALELHEVDRFLLVGLLGLSFLGLAVFAK